ncbi:MAG: bifunctional folylpolyglutamate synthase/dihydrofolate synthase [Acidimicrobiia bacterium]|nr:bifunctional folylpolyglutamate synthase/dihydrofolate synthase [Acidimicrobiia bacterium]
MDATLDWRSPDRDWALRFLGDHIGEGIRPGLSRMRAVVDLLGDPAEAYPIVHVAGTNGKTTTSRMIGALAGAHGLVAGVYTSPHLQRIEERFAVGGRPIHPDGFVRAVADVAAFTSFAVEDEVLEPPTYFELTTAIAMQAFATHGVGLGVFEVGLGGRLDATNVLSADVAVITSIGIDHTEYLGDTIAEIAGEKAGIIDGGVVVTGALPPEAMEAVRRRVEETGASWRQWGVDFAINDARRSSDGWSVDIDGQYADYTDIPLGLHGRHQVDNFGVAVAAFEGFLGRALDEEAVRTAASQVSAPGRFEVVSTRPTVVIDGAHNVSGFEALAATLVDHPTRKWTLVVGARGLRNVAEMVAPLAGLITSAVACAPADPAAIAVEETAAAVASVLGIGVESAPSVAEAVDAAIAATSTNEGIIIAGSLYVAGEARDHLVTADLTSADVWAPPPGWDDDLGEDDEDEDEGRGDDFDLFDFDDDSGR